MAEPTRIARAVILSTDAGVADRLDGLIRGLERLGIRIEHCDGIVEATELVAAEPDEPVCVLIDSRARFAELVAALGVALPGASPVVVFTSPPAELAIDAFRAGAGDVVDLDTATHGELSKMLRRIERCSGRGRDRRAMVGNLRDALDVFLRALVHAERRTIDLELQLSAVSKPDSPRLRRITDEIRDRRPVVLVVESDRELGDLMVDRLEEMGLITFGFLTGEEAVQHSKLLAASAEPIDFAVVDTALAGIDGIETLRQLRQHRPELRALVVTPAPDAETALRAGELGATDLLRKPFDDTPAVLERIHALASEAMQVGRERRYLERIKVRHEGILTRYRELRAALEQMDL
jgi:DNA-binding NtrC family response regulator